MKGNQSPLQTHSEGVILLVKVQPNARKKGILGIHAGHLKLGVQAPPERGKANQAVIEFLSAFFKISKSQIEIIRGDNQRQKQILFRGVTNQDFSELLEPMNALDVKDL